MGLSWLVTWAECSRSRPMLICGSSYLRRRRILPAVALDRAERAAPCNCRRVAHRSPCRPAALWRFASARPGSGRLRAIPATSALRVSSPSVEPSSSSRVTAADFNRSNSKGECEHSPPSNRPPEGLPMQEWRVGGGDPLSRTVGVAVRGSVGDASRRRGGFLRAHGASTPPAPRAGPCQARA